MPLRGTCGVSGGNKKRKGKEKCACRVQYTRDMAPEFANIGSEELVLQISNFHPNNTTVIKKRRILFPPAMETVYSVGCQCKVSPNAGMSIKKTASVETINADFVTSKVEEHI
ncbi:hypothetical protein BDFB_013774 [Asbolus verrucosus]|uniref:Uncharacterized protein n=1 Tax=Asbolus verrucosus TaxID=1661398 RepID=A0A482VE59_ASBVE|nr:hypothetical protein BDFB_013774 [Asbolus verrucosus]